MVKSGLDEQQVRELGGIPRVSQYRLASHLGCAFVLYSLLFNVGLNMAFPRKELKVYFRQIFTRLDKSSIEHVRSFAKSVHRIGGLIFLTAMTGAFVAGCDAGKIYNTFPLMGNGYVPSDIWIERLRWRNVFENPSTVQFIHRQMAYVTLLGCTYIWFKSKRLPTQALPRALRLSISALLGIAWGQAGLGLLTLLSNVHIHTASAHQVGSLALLTSALYTINRLHALPKLPKII